MGKVPKSYFKKEKPYLTPEKLIGRWMTLMSGTLTTTAGACVGNLSFLLGNGTGSIESATRYTVFVLIAFAALAAIFYEHKKQLNAAAKDEEKDGLTGLTESEVLALAVNEGIQNITGAMASILAQIWFNLLPSTHGGTFIIEVMICGSLILILGEYIHRSLKKGDMAEYIVNMLNGLNVGSVSWWLGYSLSNFTQNIFGAPDGESDKVDYRIFLFALAFAGIFMELLNFLSVKVSALQSQNDKPYGTVIFSALKGTPMYSAGLILNNVVQDRYTNDYVVGTLIWITISAVVVLTLDQIVHRPGKKLAPGSCYAEDAKLVYDFSTQMVSLCGQIFAFVCGQLAGFALAQHLPQESNSLWIVWGIVFQVLGFMMESARTRALPKFFKDVSAREYQLLAGA